MSAKLLPLLFKDSAAALLCPRPTFARDSALFALHPLFKDSAAALLCPRPTFARDSALFALHPLLKTVAFQQTNGRAHGRIQSALRIPRCETGCDASSHKSALSGGEC